MRRTNTDARDASMTPQFWRKDGLWHFTTVYEPTDDERKTQPVSYPEDDPGPFYKWHDEGFDTENEAVAAMTALPSFGS